MGLTGYFDSILPITILEALALRESFCWLSREQIANVSFEMNTKVVVDAI